MSRKIELPLEFNEWVAALSAADRRSYEVQYLHLSMYGSAPLVRVIIVDSAEQGWIFSNAERELYIALILSHGVWGRHT